MRGIGRIRYIRTAKIAKDYFPERIIRK